MLSLKHRNVTTYAWVLPKTFTEVAHWFYLYLRWLCLFLYLLQISFLSQMEFRAPYGFFLPEIRLYGTKKWNKNEGFITDFFRAIWTNKTLIKFVKVWIWAMNWVMIFFLLTASNFLYFATISVSPSWPNNPMHVYDHWVLASFLKADAPSIFVGSWQPMLTRKR